MKLTAPRIDAPMVEWACWWASRGWRVFPLHKPIEGERCSCGKEHSDSGKHPRNETGVSGASVDVAQIKVWWSRWPDANIGGTPPADHVILDIDGPLDDGVEFPETQTHNTGKGTHLVYRQPLDTNKHLEQTQRGATTTSQYWTNVDTRVSGKGYIVLPPSIHQSGVRYSVADSRSPVEFPAELVPERVKTKRLNAKPQATKDEVIRLLTLPRSHEDLGDAAMATVAGYLARYVPTKEHFDALLWAINQGLSDPLDETALHKKRGIFDKHQTVVQAQKAKVLDDESRGWLFEMGDVGYTTPIELKDKIEYMPWSDFRVVAKGLIIQPDNQVWIVDFHRADGSVLESQRISAATLASTGKLREWLLKRGMVLHDHQADKRKNAGGRLVKLMQSQNPPVWVSRDHYGWCDETQSFLTPQGEVTPDGLREFSGVYPEDELQYSSPTAYRFDADLEQARDWFGRVLRLQKEEESVKAGAWLMMLWLRGQWTGRLPGLLVEANAGFGKTVFWQLFSKLAGSTNDGEDMTLATARDMLSGNPSGYVWLDDVATKPGMEELIRKALTQGRMTLKEKVEGGQWRSTFKDLRGSIVISGEGVDFYRQKAYRDRFVTIEFVQNPNEDAKRLPKEDIGRASGTLLQETLKHAHLLEEYDQLLAGVTDRDKQAQVTLRMGARVLDAVMGTDNKYAELIDAWFFGKAVEQDLGQASEVVLHVLPSLWVQLGYPKSAGNGELSFPIWYDEVDQTFWVNGKRVAEAWNERKNVDARQRQLTSAVNVTRELDACEAKHATNKRVPGGLLTVKYRQLPVFYSRLVLKAADVHLEETP